MSAAMTRSSMSARPVTASHKAAVRVQCQATPVQAIVSKAKSAAAASLLAGALLSSQVQVAFANEAVQNAATNLSRDAGQAALNVANKAGGGNLLEQAGSALSNAADSVTSSVSNATSGGNPLQSAANKVGSAANSVSVSNPLQRASYAASSNASTAGNKLAAAANNATGSNPLESAANAISNAANSAASGLNLGGNPLQRAGDKVSDAADKAGSQVQRVARQLPDSNAFSGNSLKQAANKAGDKLEGAAKDAQANAGGLFSFLGKKADSAASNASNSLSKVSNGDRTASQYQAKGTGINSPNKGDPFLSRASDKVSNQLQPSAVAQRAQGAANRADNKPAQAIKDGLGKAASIVSNISSSSNPRADLKGGLNNVSNQLSNKVSNAGSDIKSSLNGGSGSSTGKFI